MSTRPLTTSSVTVPGLVLIERQQLLQKVPLSARTIYDLERRGEFPQRFTISRTKVAWDLAEVDAWIAARIAKGGHAAAPKESNSSKPKT